MSSIFLYEWKHFIRNPFKLVALFLYILAATYGLQNGSNLFQTQKEEIEKIQVKIQEEKQKFLSQYEEGKLIPEDRPWVDMSTPFWAIWNTPTYQIKTPSPAMVYSIGQAEQFGFYKRVSVWASPYDADMAEEIANPERLQTGTLDFAFAFLFLTPLLLLVLLYNVQSSEAEQGLLPLIEVQSSSTSKWLWARVIFYFSLTLLMVIGLLLYGASLTNVFKQNRSAFIEILFIGIAYLAFWTILYFFIAKNGKSILGNTLQMVGIWLLFGFIIPGIVHQTISILKPANLMTDFIEVRDKEQELYESPDSLFQDKLKALFPEIVNTSIYQDSTKRMKAVNESASALSNQMNRESLAPIELEKQQKNQWIEATFWFNPVSFFQNKMNLIAKTHYKDYQAFRQEIQSSIDERIQVLVHDIWNDVKVDRSKYIRYNETL